MKVRLAIIVLIITSFAAQADTGECYVAQQKEMLKLAHTQFCAVVDKPPAVIANALNQAMAADPNTWLPAIAWWNKVAEEYTRAGCGKS